jgi:hypothetical protein
VNAPWLPTVLVGGVALLAAVNVAQAIGVRDLRDRLAWATAANRRLARRRREDSHLIADLRAIHSSEVDVLSERLGTAEDWLALYLEPQSPATVDDEFDRITADLAPPIAPEQRRAEQ